MKILIINDNKAVSIDGLTIENLEFDIDDKIHCISFDTELKKGVVEYKNDFNKNITVFDYSKYKELFDLELKKLNPPNTYSRFNVDTKEWIVDNSLFKNYNKSKIINELLNIDKEATRPTRSIKFAELQGNEPNIDDINKLIDLEKKAIKLRSQLDEL
ncbi:hypothetical protein CRU98_10015 [Arcobacter sp. CECT 8986]|uniref:hypothetical protein n=1 Tax=Arcobacter sp. CECT 8986 TaxID=2044507 RepID=UPI001009E45A|nr:hypothetical protein [Arcobacter sp. CECT 8986]RXJ98364.1 hypothetical protein CRU98_10015 [Arcobacter sp. CECT 8986]